MVHSRVTGAGLVPDTQNVEFTVALPDSRQGDVITVSVTGTQVDEDGQLSAMAGGSRTFTQTEDAGPVEVVADVHYLTGVFNPARPISVQTQAAYVWASHLVPTPHGVQPWTVQHVGDAPPTAGTTD